MAATITDLANGVSITLNTTCVTGSTVTASVGDWLVVLAASSNDGTLGAASQTGVVDSDGVNVYVQRALINYDPAAAGAGATLGIYTCQVTNALSGDTITVNHSGNTAEKAVQVYRVAPGAGEVVTFIQADTTGATGNDSTYTVASVPINNGDIIFAGAAIETDDAVTGDSDTTNGSWSSILTRLADNGADAATMSCASQYKTVTATGTQNWGPTTATARDNARTYAILRSGVPVTAPLQTSGFEGVLPLPRNKMAIAGLGGLTIALSLLQSTLAPTEAATENIARMVYTALAQPRQVVTAWAHSPHAPLTLLNPEEPAPDAAPPSVVYTPLAQPRQPVTVWAQSSSSPLALLTEEEPEPPTDAGPRLAWTQLRGHTRPQWFYQHLSLLVEEPEEAVADVQYQVALTAVPRRQALPVAWTHRHPLVLQGQDPVTPRMWPLPVVKPALSVGFTQERRTTAIEPLAQTPAFGKAEWPIPPQPTKRLTDLQTWIQNKPQYYIEPGTPPESRPRDWPNPRGKVPPNVGSTVTRANVLVEPIPFGSQRDWPLPPQPAKRLVGLSTWSQNRPSWYVEPGIPSQSRPRDWPLPRGKQPLNVGWTITRSRVLVDPIPFGSQRDWPLPPQPAERLVGLSGWIATRARVLVEPTPQQPDGKQHWVVPLPPKPAPHTWTQNLLQSTLLPRPHRQTDWPVFRAVVQPVGLHTHLQGRPFYYVEIQGHNQHDWPLPQPIPRAESVRDWMRSHPLSLPLGPVARPDVIIQVGAEDVVIVVPADTVIEPREA